MTDEKKPLARDFPHSLPNEPTHSDPGPKYKLRTDQAEVLAGPWVLPQYKKALKKAFKGVQ